MRLILFLAALVAGGCSTGPPPAPETDPVGTLGQVFTDSKRKASTAGWTIGEPYYDIRQTAPGVPAYVGTVRFPASHKDESSEVKRLVRVEYLLQQGRWTQTKAEVKANDDPGTAWQQVTEGANPSERNLAESFKP